MMRQDRFTEQAQEVLAASQELMRQQRHTQWDVEHVLLSLVKREGGLARQILERFRVPLDELTQTLETHLNAAPKSAFPAVQAYVTPRLVRMLENADAEANRLKDEYIGVEHLLIAISDVTRGRIGPYFAHVRRGQRTDLSGIAGDSRDPPRR